HRGVKKQRVVLQCITSSRDLKGKCRMNKKRTAAVFFALLMWGLASQAPARGPEPKFNSNPDDLTKIRGVLEEFRQDIIRKDGNAITKLLLNPNVLFHH